jgi:membrane protease YdiL (CAAX protease family)
MVEGSASHQSRLWVYAVLPAVILNIVAILVFGSYYAFQAVRPDLVAAIHPDQVQFLAYVLVFVVEWIFALLLLRQQAAKGVSLVSLLAVNGRIWTFKWLPAVLLFIIFNVLFIAYIPLVSALYGQWPRFHDLVVWQRVFLVIAVPIQAAFCEELIWRGHIIPELMVRGRTRNAAILLSALSFALIHGIFLIDKLMLTFVLGLVTGAYYVRQRNLLPLMVSHFVVDVWTFALSVL